MMMTRYLILMVLDDSSIAGYTTIISMIINILSDIVPWLLASLAFLYDDISININYTLDDIDTATLIDTPPLPCCEYLN